MTALNKQALIAKIKKQTESFDTVVLKEDEANLLLDEMEAAEKTSAARLEAIGRTHKMFQRERDRADAAEKRIAEHNFENRLLANADRDIKALRQRIAELEARDEPKFVKCWSCKHDIEVLAIVDCDGYCPRCAAPIDLDDEPYAGIGVKGE